MFLKTLLIVKLLAQINIFKYSDKNDEFLTSISGMQGHSTIATNGYKLETQCTHRVNRLTSKSTHVQASLSCVKNNRLKMLSNTSVKRRY